MSDTDNLPYVEKLKHAMAGLVDRVRFAATHMSTKEYSYQFFENNLVMIKVALLLGLILLMIVNLSTGPGYSGIMAKKSGLFVAETVVFGLSAVVPLVFMYFVRAKEGWDLGTLGLYSFLAFAVFAVMNVFIELTGMWTYMFKKVEPEDAADAKVSAECAVHADRHRSQFEVALVKSVKVVGMLLVGGLLLALVIAGLRVGDFNPGFFFKDNVTGPLLTFSTVGMFLLEMGVFAVSSAAPVYLMASNRDALSAHTHSEFGLVVLKFCILHILLQSSGFYRKGFLNSTFKGLFAPSK